MEEAKKWLVKDHEGHVEGPYTTEEILQKIREKTFQGHEFISLYPDRNWVPITQEESFYDLLLSLLVSEEEGIREENEEEIETLGKREKKGEKREVEGEKKREQGEVEKEEERKETKEKEEREKREEKEEERKKEKKEAEREKEDQTITEAIDKPDRDIKRNGAEEKESELSFNLKDNDDLTDGFTQVELTKFKKEEEGKKEEGLKRESLPLSLKSPKEESFSKNQEKRKEQKKDKKEKEVKGKKKTSFLFVVVLFLFVAFGSVLLFDLNFIVDFTKSLTKPFIKSKPKFLSLRAPRKRQRPLLDIQIKQKVLKGLHYFRQDTVEAYLKAEDQWVQVIEGDSSHKNALALLCISYFKLWPFTAENSKELRVIQKVFIRASHLDLVSLQSFVCEGVYLWLGDQQEELKVFFEKILNTSFHSKLSSLEKKILAFLYYLRALSFYKEGYFDASYETLSSVKDFWPKPLLFYFFEAKLLEHFESYKEASYLYRKILKKNPRHKESLIRLGFIQIIYLNKLKRGERLLRQALEIEGKISDDGLARISLSQAVIVSRRGGELSEALKLAKKAYSLGLKSAKDFILKIKGRKKLEPEYFIDLLKDKFVIKKGDQWFHQGRYHEAQVLFERAYRKKGFHRGEAAYKAALSLWKMHLKSEAIKWFQRTLRLDPYRIEAYLYLSKYYSQNYDYSVAESILSQGFSLMPRNHALFRAIASLEKERGDYDIVQTYAERALEFYEMDLETLSLLSEALLKLDQPREALSYAKRGIEINNRKPLIHIAYAKAISNLKGRNAGVDYLEELLTKNPKEVQYLFALGELMYSENDYRRAKEYLFEAIKIKPQYREAYIQLGQVFKKLKEWQNALDAFYKALSFDVSRSDSFYEIAHVYKEQKNMRKAKEYFKKALQMNSKHPLANYSLGEISLQYRRYTSALNYAKEEKKIDPDFSLAYVLAAKSYRGRKEYNFCFDEYQKAVEKGLKSSMVYVNMAECSRLSGGLDVSISLLNYALSLESGNASIYRELGIIYETKGQWDRALKAYEKYFTLAPQAKDRSSIERRIRGRRKSR